MGWTSLRLRSDGTHATTWTEILEAAGAEAVDVEGASDELLCHDPERSDEMLWSQVWVLGLFPGSIPAEDILLRIASANGTLPPHELRFVEDADWESAVRAHFNPRHFPPNLWIYPSWCAPPPGPGIGVELDPGMAFGTGAHPTTALCLEWLSKAADSWHRSVRAIDYGCGSGILAIATVRLGAETAVGIDTDPRALEVAQDNARRNGVDRRIQFGPPGSVSAPAEIVFANILAAPLVALAPTLTSLTLPGGHLLLSGFVPDQEALVRTAFTDMEFERRVRDGWVLLAGTQRR